MSPSSPPPAAITQLRNLIHYNLDNDLLHNALFLAGRLHGLDPRSPETIYLLAQCHLKLGHFRAAYDYAKDSRVQRLASSSAASNSPSATAQLGCAYVFAQACLALRRFAEGITALERCRVLWQGRNHWARSGHGECSRGPDAPAVCNLLGRLCRANGDEKKAAEWFAESLKGNPFMWDAFVELSDAGVPIRTANIFKLTDDLRRDLFAAPAATTHPDPQPMQALASKSTNEPFTPAGYDPFNTTRSAVDPGLNYGGPNLMSRLNGNAPSQASEWDTPITNASGIHYDDDVTMDDTNAESEAPPAPLRKKTGLQSFVGDIDVPKIRGITTRGKSSRLDPPSDLDARPQTASSIPISHKRTISGQPPPPPAPSSTAGSDGGSQGIRRSTRIQNHATASTASTAAKSSASSRLAGVFSKDPKKELPKARATGTKGSTRVAQVGRNVSGNSKRFPPREGDYDAKESSRPASQASTVRELPSKRSAAAIASSNVVIEQQTQMTLSSQREQEDALKWLLELFAKLGEGYFNLSRYDAPRALDIFKSLPTASRETHWVLSKIGRALYESAKYKEAADVFARVRKLVPPSATSSSSARESGSALFGGAGNTTNALAESSWMEDMHIYSTVLWHLKRDIELAYLSHTLLSLDRLAPEPWIALGNSFSLQREHDKAIKCFKRAAQLSPPTPTGGATGSAGGVGAYAHTLMGHEHVACEEFDRATACYQQAVATAPRHYAGWYGLGSVYEKLGKYEMAERHYRVAWNVNSRNGVLAVCLGLVSEKLGRDVAGGGGAAGGGGWVLDPRGEGRVKEALGWYERAVRMDPKSAKARFMKARTLLRLAQMPSSSSSLSTAAGGPVFVTRQERLSQARDELLVLREMAPEESMVHFLLGRCLKVMGDRAGAIREMTIALELDPKKAKKELATRNTAKLNQTLYFALSIHAFYALLRLLLFSRSLTLRSLLLYAALSAPSLLIHLWLERIGRPTYTAPSPSSPSPRGDLKSAGEDLEAKGITEFAWDVLYWTWGCVAFAAAFGDRAWWLWVVVPAYGAWSAWTAVGGVRQGLAGMAGGDAGAGQEQGQSSGTSKRQAKLEKRGGQRVAYR